MISYRYSVRNFVNTDFKISPSSSFKLKTLLTILTSTKFSKTHQNYCHWELQPNMKSSLLTTLKTIIKALLFTWRYRLKSRLTTLTVVAKSLLYYLNYYLRWLIIIITKELYLNHVCCCLFLRPVTSWVANWIISLHFTL